MPKTIFKKQGIFYMLQSFQWLKFNIPEIATAWRGSWNKQELMMKISTQYKKF